MKMNMIGDKELVFEKTFVCSDNEVVSFDVDMHGTNVKFVITFRAVEPSLGATVNWSGTPQEIKIEFVGWNSTLGTVSLSPDKVGLLGGQPIGMQIAHFRIGPKNLAHFAILLGGAYA